MKQVNESERCDATKDYRANWGEDVRARLACQVWPTCMKQMEFLGTTGGSQLIRSRGLGQESRVRHPKVPGVV